MGRGLTDVSWDCGADWDWRWVWSGGCEGEEEGEGVRKGVGRIVGSLEERKRVICGCVVVMVMVEVGCEKDVS